MKITYPNFAQLSPLQKHVAFFDENEDGVLTVSETAAGLRELGQNALLSYPSALLIHAGLAPQMNGTVFNLDLRVADIPKGKHDSDTDIYTATGELDMARFEALFTRFDANESGSLSASEIAAMRASVADRGLFGKAAASAEWSVLLSLLSDARETNAWGVSERAISKAGLASFYAGTLLFERAGR